ncbi:hypothetical protein LF817_14970 [Halobacillus sp. A1]|uniref:hypothetical protein n=1 Tax=Halobacillus sp. A1 TaxID=2880262 RepID=UPI0020A68C19|nr:hypothetical protein [Halobacillus sp. A1]MCP3032626.1 hypothetical protein [Halobacillus sp. A1]
MDKHKIHYEQGEVIKPDFDVEDAKSLAIYAEIPLKILEKDKNRIEICKSDVFCAEGKQSLLNLQSKTKLVEVIAIGSGETVYPNIIKYS